jgi:hypothetical protein
MLRSTDRVNRPSPTTPGTRTPFDGRPRVEFPRVDPVVNLAIERWYNPLVICYIAMENGNL